MKLIFWMQISMKACYILIWFWWGWSSIPKVPKIASLQYLYNIFATCHHYWQAWSSILKLLKVTSLQYLYKISKKKFGMEFILYNISKSELEMKLIFCMQIKYQSFLKVDFDTLGIKVSYKMILWLMMGTIKHSRIT